MSLSYAIEHASSNTTESLTISVAEKSTMTLQSTQVDPKTGRTTATYLISSGDVNHPAYVIYVADPVLNAAKTRYASVTFKTWATQTDSVTGAVLWYPVQSTVSFVIANGAPVQLADFSKFINCAMSYTYASVTSGAKDTAWLQSLLFGNPAVK